MYVDRGGTKVLIHNSLGSFRRGGRIRFDQWQQYLYDSLEITASALYQGLLACGMERLTKHQTRRIC